MDNQPPHSTPETQATSAPQPTPPTPTVSPTPTAVPLQAPQVITPGDVSTQPVVVGTMQTNSPQPAPAPMIFGQNQNYTAFNPRGKAVPLMFGLAGVLLLVIAALYFWFLPMRWANAFTNNIKPLYEQQSAQLPTVYQSTSRPLFTSTHVTLASDNQDIAYINGLLKTATNNTNALKAKNHLTVLPGTSWLSSVSSADREYKAMQQYITDSQAFLSDYQTLTTYMQQMDQIATQQFPALTSDFKAIKAAEARPNKATLLASLQKANSDMQAISVRVKALKPSPDVQGFNSDMLNDLNGMENGLQQLISALSGNTSINPLDAAQEFQSAAVNLEQASAANPTANIPTSSTIHNQIVTLQSEHPLPQK